MISKEEAERISRLARLELVAKEIGKIQKDLSEILDYFILLKNVPKIKEIKNVTGDLKCARQDNDRLSGKADAIIAAAPDKKDSYIKVKAIL